MGYRVPADDVVLDRKPKCWKRLKAKGPRDLETPGCPAGDRHLGPLVGAYADRGRQLQVGAVIGNCGRAQVVFGGRLVFKLVIVATS